ncbi:hypothetical protein U1769_01815 [Sphingomonas sp. ZT3P38]|uniref:hypothetical protein n=1 Tax=Parasphingomonas zepuensis TaxID=3096161 RepID=UPI002FC68268
MAVVLATVTGGCASDPSDLIAQHKRANRHPRPIDLLDGKAAAEAQKACGGKAVRLEVEGDQADYGWDPTHYKCAE